MNFTSIFIFLLYFSDGEQFSGCDGNRAGMGGRIEGWKIFTWSEIFIFQIESEIFV